MRTLTMLLLLAAMPSLAGPSGEDRFLGTWQLDPAACHYESGPVPESMLIVMQPADEGVHYRSVTTLKGGGTATADYTAAYDGRAVLVESTAGVMVPIALTRLDDSTVVARYTRAFSVVAESRRVLDAAGRVLTITTTTGGVTGHDFTNVAVYRRVEPDVPPG